MLLTKEQINDFINLVGQPKASVILNNFFNSYRKFLCSNQVSALYDDNYLKVLSSHPIYELINDKYGIHIYNKYSYEYILSKKVNDKSILDIGCGDGDFLLALASKGAKRCLGIDLSAKAIERADSKKRESGLNNCAFILNDVSDLSSGDTFDFIVLNDVIEHLSDAELLLLFSKIKNLLDKNGEIVIHTPNGLALCNDVDSNWLQKCYKNYLRHFKGWKGFERTVNQIYYDQTHINIKSYKQLQLFLSSLGYDSKVIYDNDSNKIFFMNQFSSNMLVIAS